MDADSDEADDFICPICSRSFASMAGLKTHWSKGHDKAEIDSAINLATAVPVSASSTTTVHSLLLPDQPAVTPQSRVSSNSASQTLHERETCRDCGFIAKNERGLKVHRRVHASQLTTVNQRAAPSANSIDNLDDVSIVQRFGEVLYKCKCSIPVVRIIQKSVRTIVCQELTKVVELASSKNDVFAWLRLLCFPTIVLNSIPKLNYKDSHCPNVIRQNLQIFAKLTDIPSLFSELLKLLAVDVPKKIKSHSEKLIIKIAQRKVAEGDISGAVRVLSSDDGVAECTPENVSKLKLKHPDEDTPTGLDPPTNQRFETSSDQVVNSIKHFPISSSGGIDGLRPRHLKDLISFSCGDSSAKLTSAVAKLVNVIRSGKISSVLCPIFYGASLIALAKKNGDIRPIAIGLVWRRLAGKIACFSVKDSLAQALSPIQNGFGVRGGSEAIIHAVRAFAETHHDSPKAIVKFDFKNAFNELFRKFLLGETKDLAPSLYPMLYQAYSSSSNLFFGDVIIESKRGTQQGDPCAPVAFCIGIMKLTHSLSARLNTWFLDDGTIGDDFDAILEDVKKVIAFSDVSGLSLNPTKCEVIFLNAPTVSQTEMLEKLNALLPGIKLINDSSFQLLGAPITVPSIPSSLASGLQTVQTLCKRLTSLDVHPALRLLRSSLSSPRFLHLLRTSPTYNFTEQLSEIDQFYRDTLQAITNNDISDRSWTQASLPLQFSGLGIRKLVDLAHPAYFSSVFQSQALSDQILAKLNRSILTDNFVSALVEYPLEFTPTSDDLKMHQNCWDQLRTKHIFDDLLSTSDQINRARLLASSTKPSSKWLQAVPSQQLGLLLDNNSARIAVALRLGNKVCEPHKCICGEMVDSNGYHALSCNKTKGKYVTHAKINQIFSMAFIAAGCPNKLEPPGLSRRDGKRPDGITNYPWRRGKSLIWDATVVNTVAATYLSNTSLKSGAAADEAERASLVSIILLPKIPPEALYHSFSSYYHKYLVDI